MLNYIMHIPLINLQALVALFLFVLSLLLSRLIMKIHRKELPGSDMFILYLRFILGLVFAGAIAFSFYSFAGINILF